MQVRELMTKEARRVRAQDTLEIAARQMWDGDCGCLPVVDDGERVIGVVTDRDACMCAYTRGADLRQLPVEMAMARRVHTCRAEDTVETALALMAERQVRRLPVVDDKGRLLGVVTINDIFRKAQQAKADTALVTQVLQAQVQIASPRPQGAPAAKPATGKPVAAAAKPAAAAADVVQPAERKAPSAAAAKPAATKTGRAAKS